MRSKNPCNRTRKFLLNGIFLCLLIGIKAESACKKGCPRSDNGLLKYVAGHVYDYNYDSSMTIGVNSGVEGDETALKVAGHAKLFAEGNCGYTLQLDRISVSAVKESLEKQITQNIAKPIHFTMVSGELEPEICADPSDTIYSLNIKRGIVSMLQSATAAGGDSGGKTTHETDVFGVCPTTTSTTKSPSGGEIITKTRNLNNCAYREQLANGMINGIVNERAGIKSRFLLAADYAKEMKLNRAGLIEQVQLFEEYKSLAATKGEPGVKAKVKTILKLSNGGAGKAQAAPATDVAGQPMSIIFEKPDSHSVKNINALKKVFIQTANLVNDYVQGDASQYFTELIRLMRSADADTLTELASVPYQNKILGRNVYLDALFRVGTSEAIKSIVRQIPKMSEKEKKMAFLSMYLVQNVNKEALNQAASLLNGNSPKEAFLAIGYLVDKYCKHGTCDQTEVNVVSKKFTDSLRHCKANTKRDEDRIVYVLKGIRNTHKIADASAATLIECASVAHPARIRVAAIQAFAAASCNANLQTKSLALLRDRNEDSEIRIEAYLTLIQCPNGKVANEIADIVNSETVYQVGGFIVSNLKAIRDSTDASRELARHHFGNIPITQKFPIDPRRYSFNHELSYAIESMGMGASVDYNLIYSQHGFLPRSGHFNVTSELFGTNCNLIEMSMRQENMENVFEYYFGPKGLFQKEPQEILDAITSGGGDSGGDRPKRSIVDDTQKFGKKYKTYGSRSTNDMHLDVSLRFFGSEIYFLSLGDNIPNTIDDIIKLFSIGLDKVKTNLKSYQHQIGVHSLFLDTKFLYPTGLGLPMELFGQGFAAIKIDLKTEIDFDDSSKYRLKIIPSGDININLQLRFNAFVLASGIRMQTRLHSAIGNDVTFKFLNANGGGSGSNTGDDGFNIDIVLPRENLQLIDIKMSTDFIVAEQDKEIHAIPLKSGLKKRKNPQPPQPNCFDQLQLFGFTICYTSVMPDTLSGKQVAAAAGAAGAQTPTASDLMGPFQFTVTMHSERKFNIKGVTNAAAAATAANDSKQWKLLYSTPNSKESHNTELTLEIGMKSKLFTRIAFDHPQKHLSLEIGAHNNDRELIVYGKYEIDNDHKQYKIGFNKLNPTEYKPIIEMKHNDQIRNEIAGYRTDGLVTIKKDQHDSQKTNYQFDNFQLIDRNNQRLILINGWTEINLSSFKSSLMITPNFNQQQQQQQQLAEPEKPERPPQTYELKSHLTIDPVHGHSIGLFVNKLKDTNSIYGGSIYILIDEKQIKCELIGKCGNDLSMQLNNHIEYVKRTDRRKSNDKANEKLLIDNFASLKMVNFIKIHNQNAIVENVKVADENVLIAGKLNIEFIANKLLTIDTELQRFNKRILANMKLMKNAAFDYDLDLLMKLNKHFVDLKSKCQPKGGQHLLIDNILTTSWGTMVTLKGEIGGQQQQSTSSSSQSMQSTFNIHEIYIDLHGTIVITPKDKENHFTIKMIGNSNNDNKMIIDFKLTRDNSDLIVFVGELQSAAAAAATQQSSPAATAAATTNVQSAKINLHIKDSLAIKTDMKLNMKNGKGDLLAMMNLKKLSHKISIDSKFVLLAPKYDIETTATLDTGAGPQKYFYYKSENQFDKSKFASKNQFEMNERKTQFDIDAAIRGDWRWNGEIDTNFQLQLPTGRKINGEFNRKMIMANNQIVHGTGAIQLTDQIDTDENNKRSFSANMKLDKFNMRTRELQMEMDMNLQMFEKRKYTIKYNLKHLMKTGGTSMKMFEYNLETIGGNVVDDDNHNYLLPLTMNVIIDEYDGQHAIFNVKMKNQQIHCNFNGQYNYQLNSIAHQQQHVKSNEITMKYELAMNCNRLQQQQQQQQQSKTTMNNFILSTSGKLLKSINYNEIIFNFDSSTDNGHSMKMLTLINGTANNYNYKLDFISDQSDKPIELIGSYQFVPNVERKIFFNCQHGPEKFVKNAFNYNYELNKINYEISTSFETIQQIQMEMQFNNDDNSKLIAIAKYNNNENNFKLNTILYTNENKKGIELIMNLNSKNVDDNANAIKCIGIVEFQHDGGNDDDGNAMKLQIELNRLFDFDMKSNVNINLKAINHFYIIGSINSNQLKIKQLQFDIKSMEKNLIQFHIKNIAETILNGQLTYAMNKSEKNKIIMEGQGNVQYYDKTTNANFKLIHQIYDANVDNEIGFSYTFNGNFGPKNAISTIKMTNKNCHMKLSICEEKKQCTNIEIRSILTVPPPSQTINDATKSIASPPPIHQHDLMILIDLRELGYPHEFELQSKSLYNNLKYQYELESNIISNSNLKYQLIVNRIHEQMKIQLKLPKRDLLFNIEHKMPSQQLFGHYSNKLEFYFDKMNQPNDVTRLQFNADLTQIERIAYNCKGEMKFEHPTIRPMTIIGEIDINRDKQFIHNQLTFDIFRLVEQQIIVSNKIANRIDRIDEKTATTAAAGKTILTSVLPTFNLTMENRISNGDQTIQYQFIGYTSLNGKQLEFMGGSEMLIGNKNSINQLLMINQNGFQLLLKNDDGGGDAGATTTSSLNVNGEFNRKQLGMKIHMKMQLFGTKPLIVVGEFQPAMYKIDVDNKNLIAISGEMRLGKEATIKIASGNDGKTMLLNGRMALDVGHFLNVNYDTNEKNIDEFMKSVENDVTENTKKAGELIEKRYKKLKETIDRQIGAVKDRAPDFSKLQANYESNINEIFKELEMDPALKQLFDNYRKLYEILSKLITDVTKVVTTAYEKLYKTVSNLYEKCLITFNEVIAPAMKDFSQKMIKIIGKMRIEIIRLSKNAIEQIMKSYKTIEPEMKALIKPIIELLKPFNDAIDELMKALKIEFNDLLNDINEYIEKLPTFDAITSTIKEKLMKMKLIDEILKCLHDFVEQLQQLPGQTPEMQEFTMKFYNYIEGKLKGKMLNDMEMLEELYVTFVNAIRSIWLNWNETFAAAAAGGGGGASATNAIDFTGYLSPMLPATYDFFANKLPSWITLKFSLINFMYNEKLLDFARMLKLIQPMPYDSGNLLPPFNLKGHIIDGQYMITFDNRLYVWPGGCKYILAQDIVDNNFTVIAQIKDGKMKSISLVDGSGHYADINDNGQLKIDGKPMEYPYHQDDIHVWRNYYTIWMHTNYGVEIVCAIDLKLCHVVVNGFYTSKMRGLLGNGNAEPNDDFTMVDGTIVDDDVAAFGNAYALGGNCQAVQVAAAAATTTTTTTPATPNICSELFGYDSPLLFGYMFIDSMPYRKACNIAIGKDNKDEEANACTMAMAYASAVKLEHLPIHLPKRCIKCPSGGQQQQQRDYESEFNVKIPTNKADIVFVVDIDASKSILDNLVTPAITDLRQQMKQRGFTDVQVAVIAYSQKQLYPSLLTSNGGKLNYQGQFSAMIPKGPEKELPLDVGTEKVNQLIKMIASIYDRLATQSDELAFRMAVQYPFRASAAKSLIAVRSDQLEYGNMFKFVRAHLEVNSFDGVIVHLVAPVKDLSLEGVQPQKLIGFNSRIVSTTEGKDAKKRPKLQYANDMGVDLVLNNGGWIFASQNFEQMKEKNDQEQFVNQMTASISDTLFKTEMINDCKCVAAYGLHGQNKCTVKSTTFQPNKRPKGSK